MHKQSFRSDNGFTLIELMIVMAIMGIVAAVAAPIYGSYTKQAKFSEVVSMTAAYKSAVHLCIQDYNTTTNCSSGNNGIPPDIAVPTGYVQSLTTVDGTITSTAIAEIDGLTFILTPTYNAVTNSATWAVSGTCLAAGYCK